MARLPAGMRMERVLGPAVRRRLRPLVVRLRHRGIGRADVLLASYPRSGSTWLRFLLYECLTGRPAEFDDVNRDLPDVGRHGRATPLLPGGGRPIKSHERYRSAAGRVVYLVRDPRAVVPSMYRQSLRTGATMSWERFLQAAVTGLASPFGTWADHVRFWLRAGPAAPNGFLLVRFEDLRADPVATLTALLKFLGVSIPEVAIRSAVDGNDLASMRAKEARASSRAIVNRSPDLPFVGAGEREGWRSLTPGDVHRLEQHAGELLGRLGYSSGDRVDRRAVRAARARPRRRA